MENVENKESFFQKNKGLISIAAVLIVFLAAYFLGPFRLVAVVSGSMEPTIPTWSLCVVNVKTPYEKLETGDVIVFYRKSDGLRIIHRIIQYSEDGIVTKGDANSIDDSLNGKPNVDATNYYGKSLCHIPKLGKLAMYSKTPAGIAVIGVAFVAVLIWTVTDDVRERKKKESETPEEEQEEQN